MRAPQRLREIAVALVGDDDRRAGFRDQEIRAGDADIGRKKLFAQHGAGLGEQAFGRGEIAILVEIDMDAAEVLLHLFLVEMHRRRDDVRRRLAAQLDDVFAEVGFDRPHARGLDGGVEADFLGHHRLALGDHARAARLADVDDHRAGLRGIAGEMHVAA